MPAASPTVLHLLPDSALPCFIVPGAFTAADCDELLTPAIKASLHSAATHYPTYYRNNERSIVDSAALAERLLRVIRPVLPPELPADSPGTGPWRLKALNSRLRFCRYAAGQYFHRHLDGVYHQSATVQSRLTFMVYLNDAAEFGGGRTLFYRSKDDPAVWAEYWPAKGDLIVFDHRLWHEGEELTAGQKYVLRSDILYETAPVAPAPAAAFTPGHLGYVWQVLPFADSILSAGRDTIIKVWSAAGKLRQELAGHRNSVLSLCQLNADTLLSGSRDATIRVWERRGGQFQPARVLTPHAATVLAVRRLTDTTFVSAAADHLIKVSDVDGTLLRVLAGHTDWVWQVAPVAEGQLVSASEDGTLRLWDWRRGECQCIIAQGLAPVHALLFDPATRRLLTGNYAGEIQVWEPTAESGAWQPGATIAAHRGIVRTLTLLPGGRLASGGEDNKVKVWHLATGRLEQEMDHDDFVQSTAWLPEPQQLISAAYDGRLRLWDVGA